MSSDFAFQIGKTHDICQDFALTGKFESPGGDANYLIVSDGCSSSPNVDLGARILSYSIVNELKNLYHNSASPMFNFNADSCISKARASINSLAIDPNSLDATALILYSAENDTEIIIKGDGCVAIGLSDKRILVINIEFPNGFPFYMNYFPLYSLRYNQWYQQLVKNDEEPIITSSIINTDGTFEQFDDKCSPEFTFFGDKKTPIISCRQDNHGGTIRYSINEKRKLEFVVLMSDGISSFYKTQDSGTSLTNSNIDYREVIKNILNFKNFNGQFMRRRLNRFLKFCTKNNWHHSDDISFAAIYFGN